MVWGENSEAGGRLREYSDGGRGSACLPRHLRGGRRQGVLGG